MAKQGRVFRSKIDTWIAVVIALCVLVSIATVAASLVLTESVVAIVVGASVLATGAGIPIWLALSTHYTLTDQALVVRSGPARWCIPLAEIKSIRPTRDPVSSPALSIDRLEIQYGAYKSLMISPREQAEFLRELETARNRFGGE